MNTKSKVITVLVGAVLVGMPMAKADVSPYPVHRHGSVEAYSADLYQFTFEGGEQAVVMVVGDGSTDLDLLVGDENGNLVCGDIGITDNCLVWWTPRSTGTFTIAVLNQGAEHNHYALWTN